MKNLLLLKRLKFLLMKMTKFTKHECLKINEVNKEYGGCYVIHKHKGFDWHIEIEIGNGSFIDVIKIKYCPYCQKILE